MIEDRGDVESILDKYKKDELTQIQNVINHASENAESGIQNSSNTSTGGKRTNKNKKRYRISKHHYLKKLNTRNTQRNMRNHLRKTISYRHL